MSSWPQISLLLLTFLFSTDKAVAASVRCLTGGNDMWLEQQLKPGRGRDFVQSWIAERNPMEVECPECLRRGTVNYDFSAMSSSAAVFLGANATPLFDVFQRLGVDSPQRFISRECIAKSVQRIPNITGINRVQCASDSSEPRVSAVTPCVSDTYVSFMEFTFNKAMQCLSRRGSRIDAQATFEKINNESAFGGFLSGTQRLGVSQLMPITAVEMLGSSHRGNKFLKARMRSEDGIVKPDCEPFKRLIGGTDLNSGCSGKCMCTLASVPNGIARNVLAGLGIYLYMREGTAGSVDERMKKLDLNFHKDRERIRDLFTLIAYNKGLAGSSATLIQLAPYLKGSQALTYLELKKMLSQRPPPLRGGRCPSDWPLPRVKTAGSPCRSLYQDYVAAMRNKMSEAPIGNPNADCSVEERP